MSKYTIYYTTKQYTYRKLAETWKAWADTSELSESQQRGMSLFFRHIGRRFGLITKFKDIGVIQNCE